MSNEQKQANVVAANPNGTRVGFFDGIRNWWGSKTTLQKIGTVGLTLLAGYGAYEGISGAVDYFSADDDDEDSCGE